MKLSDSLQSLHVEERVQRIVTTIRAEEARLRAKYTFLKYQDLIGLAIMLFSLAGMLGSAALYYYEAIPVWAAIVLAAIFASLSHELEHDLIHRQYFKKNAFMHNLMMWVVWIMRPNTINPWYRRKLHFLHHKTSGTQQDLEERLVGNGIGNFLLRYLVMFDGLLGMLVRRKILAKEVDEFDVEKMLSSAFPIAVLYFTAWYAFLVFHGVDFLWGAELAYPEWLLSIVAGLNFLVVVLIAPNFLRSGCLNFVTSHMHYYGGVDNILQQTQVLKGWFMFPFHLFCFNFGSTHGIHHFVVGQPFYIRQMVAKVAHKVMKENGVRFNDLKTFINANRYTADPSS
ncbi:fatty acid desaturase [Dasania sp. GY-MA-18]|uniref:Fatty acid desaturase n=1 Tax=Dasania phycosphaerae TaxID=2950436 RepID=A0A9J6RNV4_9GAMM|nr:MULTISPECIES: fatty acid desaturase [Dasania]MCR8923584.1 fatty acid desaturase [Dasania sp. GY-MA-18]MCZ0866018.1 fatty acid desaturase [Dasania phycosphaerae]MCZ0869742.1 fatty acid desaturase [Dasania phycosphaerae]